MGGGRGVIVNLGPIGAGSGCMCVKFKYGRIVYESVYFGFALGVRVRVMGIIN